MWYELEIYSGDQPAEVLWRGDDPRVGRALALLAERYEGDGVVLVERETQYGGADLACWEL